MKPQCPVFRRCGGCQLLDMAYPAQLEAKQRRVEALLGRFGAVQPIRGMETPYHYRNKVLASFAEGRGGAIESGVYQAGTRRVVPVSACLINDAAADRIIGTVRDLLRSFRLKPWNPRTGRGFLRHVLVKRGFATNEVMVVLVAANNLFPAKNFTAALRKAHPEITTVVLNLNDRRTAVVLGERERVLYGPGYIEDELCGCRFRISAKSFYQVNPIQCAVLYNLALDCAQITAQDTVIDAYCGIGTIGLIAAKRAGQVIGVENNREAVRDAIANARQNHAKNIRFLCADATEFLEAMAADGGHADVLFMDPPRAGSTQRFLQAVAAVGPRRVVNISCNPETQARDLAWLCPLGYSVQRIQPVDMFPHTTHVETVVLLSKGEIDSKKVRVEFSLEDMDMSGFQNDATYSQIKERVLQQTGLKVSSLYIAQIKQKHGIIERENYNKPKSENTRQPKCPPEKEAAITEALKYFGMI